MGVGIDISGVQNVAIASGDWEFVTVKTSEGVHVPNNLASAQLGAVRAGTRKGVYHYARPGISDGASQANFFADDALARGFEPGKWMWQLDVEGIGNESVTGPQWRAFVDAFMEVGLARLGQLGFLYQGLYFFRDAIQPQRYNWWVPAYGNNDGSLHPLPAGVNPVLHQYTSAGGLDRNAVHDVARWNQLIGTTATQPSQPQEDDRVILTPRLAVPTIDTGGKVPEIYFDRATKTLQSFGYDFVRSTPGWQFSEGYGLVLAKLTVPTTDDNNTADLSFDETPDGRVIYVWAKGDRGTFKLPYKQVMANTTPVAAKLDYADIAAHLNAQTVVSAK